VSFNKFDVYKNNLYTLRIMVYINNKLQYLIQNVFSKINTDNISKQLDEIQSERDYTLNESKKVYIKSPMEKLFCKGKLLINRSNEHTISTCSKLSPLTNSDRNSLKNIDYSEVDIMKSNIVKPIKKPLLVQSTSRNDISCPCLYLNKIKEQDQNIFIIQLKKEGDYLSKLFFSSLSNLFYMMNPIDQLQELKQIKSKLINTFNQENYYKEYDYSTKHFKKIEADDVFSNNRPITINMLKIYGDILNVNVVFIQSNKIDYITKFNIKNATVILSENNNLVYTYTSTLSPPFIRGSMLVDILCTNKKYSKNELEKKKLDELQNIAKMNNLNIKKMGKVSKINITKLELINMLHIE